MFSKKREKLLCGILIAVSIILFFVASGTLTSGYHFTDDHQFVVINEELKVVPVLQTINKWITQDFNIRFRPLYYAIRVLEVWAFKLNFFAYSAYRMLLFIVTSLFFFYGALKLKWYRSVAIAFIIIGFVGSQMAIWWRLGPNETYGIFFMAIAFYVAIANEQDKVYMFHLRNIIFMFAVICSTMCKESFMISVPAMIFFRISTIRLDGKNGGWKSACLKFLPYAVILLAVMFGELLFIVKFVGMNQIGYAGVDRSVKKLVKEFITSYTTDISLEIFQVYIILILSVAFVLSQQEIANIRKTVISFWRQNFTAIIFALLVFAPNCILYAKSGMVERYMIPSTVALSFLICSIANSIPRKNAGVFTNAVFVIFILTGLITFRHAWNFKRQGFKTQVMLSDIDKYSVREGTVLVVAHPIEFLEWRYSIKIYLENIHQKKVFFFDESLQDGFVPDVIAGWDKEDVSSYVEQNFPDYVYKTTDERNYCVYAQK